MNKLNLSLALMTLGLLGQSAQAAIINSTFNGTIDSGALTGQSFSGNYSYDDSLLTGISDESIPVTSFSLSFNSETFNNSNAISAAEAVFLNSNFLGLQYSSEIVNDLSVSLIAGFPNIDNAFITYDLVGEISGSGDIIYNQGSVPIPEPSSILGIVTVTIVGVLKKRY